MADANQESSKKRISESLSEVESDLYKKSTSDGVRIRERAFLHPNRTDTNTNWDPNEDHPSMNKRTKKRTTRFSWSQKLFFISFLLFVIAAGFTFVTFWQNRNTVSSKNIDIVMDHVTFTDGGDELIVSVDVTNRNHSPLRSTAVALEYPSLSALNANGIAREVKELDVLLPGETKTAEFSIVLYGEQGTQHPLQAGFQYRVEGSNAIFEKTSDTLITLRSTPIDIVLDARTEIVSGQSATYDFSIISQSEGELTDIMFELDTPPGFEITESEPRSLLGRDIWNLGSFDPLEEKTVRITGVINGQPNEAKTLRAFVGTAQSSSSETLATVFNSLSQKITLVQPFLAAEIFVDRSTEEIINFAPGRQISGAIVWRNTLQEAVKSPEIVLTMRGSAYDAEAVDAQAGFFNSNDDTIVWTKATQDSLEVVEPGEVGDLRFSLTPRSLGAFAFSRPEVVLSVGVRGIGASGQLYEADQTDLMRIQFSSVLEVAAEALHYTGPFSNRGAMPPRAGRTTDYAVKWTVTNSANPVSRGRVTATLPPYVEWAGQTSPSSESIRYDSGSRTVVWDLGEVDPGVGYGARGRSAYFQVRLTPSTSQISETVQLTSEVEITGTDAHTELPLSSTTRGSTTRLLNDGDGRGTSGRVEE